MADPGFPWGGANLPRVHFLAKTYAKTKGIDPVGGGGGGAGGAHLDPPMGSSFAIIMAIIPKELLLFADCMFSHNSSSL